ncbi:trypsin-like serine peptidase [Robiginitomaculum antarcticum]|uniref:trypsin-like serine peptidase n=1 Tax=Robiginitomaculum antarcticum TaxID=437507 RepID=UPI00036A3E46|nr:hypothetical protein [Robiginitomaculum antarcticum]
MKKTIKALLGCSALMGLAFAAPGLANAEGKPDAKSQKVFDHWSQDRIDDAQPRDMRLDHRGLAYMKNRDGKMMPYGHAKKYELKQERIKAAKKPQPTAKPVKDSTAPAIMSMSPADGAVIGANQTFSAVVTDAGSGVRSVSFEINYNGGSQTFAGTFIGNDTWEVNLSGFPAGPGNWRVVATDNAKRGGNVSTSQSRNFTVDLGTGDPDPSPDIVTNSRWTKGGDIQYSTGRLFYEMPTDTRLMRWAGYVCSGTVASDATTGRSVIITAAHCVYNDQYKAFARNVLFIPNQDGTTGAGTDSNCTNDPIGCWTSNFGVVDINWTTRTFPDNIPWDYAYYVVNDSGSHSGAASSSDSLDTAVPTQSISFSAPVVDDGTAGPLTQDYTHALGYSYSEDPFFMYSAEDMTTEGTANWWLPSSGLSGGSSGGPWIQPMNETSGSGPLISVNSWGYNTSPGMAGPKLNGTSASCVFNAAKSGDLNLANNSDGNQGVAANCP